MKTITLINWYLLGIYAAVLLGIMLFSRASSSSDRAAGGYVLVLFIPLAILAALNLVQSPFTRILVLIVAALPGGTGIVMLVAGPAVENWQTRSYDKELAAKENGSFYFRDKTLRKLAGNIASGDIEALKAGLEQPVPQLNASGEEQVTLLDFATIHAKKDTSKNRIAVLQLLLDKGAAITTTDTARSPAHFRALEAGPELLEWFLKNGANANAVEASKGFSILFEAMGLDNGDSARTEKVKLLLRYGADPNKIPTLKDKSYILLSPLTWAVDRELWEISIVLLDNGADASYQARSGWNVGKAVEYKLEQLRLLGKTPSNEMTTFIERLRGHEGGKPIQESAK
jgi:hypothetical protein